VILHRIYGREQSLSDILDGLIMKLGEARILYGPGRSLPEAVSGLYYLLDEMRKLYGSDSAEEILSGIIERKRRSNRLVELKRVSMGMRLTHGCPLGSMSSTMRANLPSSVPKT
jgi:hypothetical protein